MPEDKYNSLGMMNITNTASSGGMNPGEAFLVDWKLIFAMMLLASSQVASDVNLETYKERLIANSKDGLISLSSFIDVDAWFDRTEGATSVSKLLRAVNSSAESEDEQEDTEEDVQKAAETSKLVRERLTTVKRLMWQAFKRTNDDGLRIEEYIQALGKLSEICKD